MGSPSSARVWLLLCALAWACGTEEPSVPAQAGPGQPPTLVLILADDLGWGDLGCYGSPSISTPHIDRLAADGARFTAFYANAPICSPSRASILSGLQPAQTGVVRAILKRERRVEDGQLRPDLELLPARLGRSGYHSALIGKWHLGYEPGDLPEARGFDEFAGYPMGASYNAAESRALVRAGEAWETEGLLPRVLTDEALRVLAQPRDEPLFLCLSYKTPHTDLADAAAFLPDRIAAHRARGAAEQQALYFALVEELDHQVGRVLSTLEASGRADNALVVFASDNGPNLKARGASAKPFRQGKGSVLEGGIRVPAIVRWPARVPAGLQVDTPVAGCDLFATFLSAAGIPPPSHNGPSPLAGLDLFEALAAPATAFLDRDLFWFAREQLALRHGRWKLVAEIDAVPSEDWSATLEAFDACTPVLFDLDLDPREEHNVAEQHPDALRDLRERLRQRLRAARDLPDPRG